MNFMEHVSENLRQLVHVARRIWGPVRTPRAELRNLAVTHDPQGFANVVAVVGPTATRCEWCGGTGIQTWQALIAGAGHAGGFLSNPGIHGSHPEFATLITSGFHTQMALNYPSICVNKSGTRIRLDDWIGKFI